MRTELLARWRHDHVFDAGNAAAERGTRIVMWITAVAMAVEITAGWWFNSMALLADGWHMSSHAVAIGLSAIAYAAARGNARDPRFAFGTWKIEILAGFGGAIFLLGVAVLMLVGSIERFIWPQPIQYREAVVVAALGLAVNIACALILGQAHDHGHPHEHAHGGSGGHGAHQDLNLKAAYLHVIADAMTSVLALVALIGGWFYGASWLDPLMGIVGAILIALWAKGLLVDSAKVLLDREMDHPVVREIREVVEIERDGADSRIADLHVWRVGRHAYSCAMTVVTTDATLTADGVRERLSIHEEIVHSTIEIHHLPDEYAAAADADTPAQEIFVRA